MPVNWLEIGLNWGFILALLGIVVLYVRVRGLPRAKAAAAQWVGGAIGRFMQNLAEQAEAEEGGGATGGGGILNIGGFQVSPELLRTGMELLKMAQELGFIKTGGSGGGGAHPFSP